MRCAFSHDLPSPGVARGVQEVREGLGSQALGLGVVRPALTGGTRGGAEVVGEQLVELTDPVTGRCLDPRRHAGVSRRALAMGEAFVGDVAREDVLERVLALAGDRATKAEKRSGLGPGARGAWRRRRRRRRRAERAGPGQKSRPTTAAPCSRRLAAGSSRSILAARTPCTVSGISTSATAAVRAPAAGFEEDVPAVDQMPQDLLEEERVALTTLEDARADAVGQVVDREQRADQMLGLVATEWIQRDRGEVASPPPHPGLRDGELRAGGTQEQDAPGDALRELVKEVEERGVRPVDVLDDGDRRRRGAQARRRTIATRRGSRRGRRADPCRRTGTPGPRRPRCRRGRPSSVPDRP